MKKIILNFLLLAILTLAVFVCAGRTNAKETEKGMILSPATISLALPAGEVTTQELTFVNNTEKDNGFEVYLSDYQAIDATGKSFQFLPAGQAPDSLNNIINIDPVRFDLRKGQKIKINLRVSPSKNIEAGKYKGVIFISTVNPEKISSGIEVITNGKVGAMVGVSIKSENQNQVARLLKNQNKYFYAIMAAVAILFAVFGVIRRKKIVRKNKL